MRVPRATYRFQFNSEFTFNQARPLIQYLSDLGISDVYASPIFAARKGSVHGYDVVDPTILNPEIGSEQDFRDITREVKEKRMGWLQDIVPNHMAFDGQNRMLMDVLENGEASEYHKFFDIEWNHAYEGMQGRLLAPFLGKPYAECLHADEIKVEFSPKGFTVRYYGLKFSLAFESYARVLFNRLNILKRRMDPDNPDFIKFIGVLYMLKALPCQELEGERYDQVRFAKRMLWELYTRNREIREFIDDNLSELNGETTGSHDLLDNLLMDQFFRLSFWKVASEELNYRRFFTINELISLRVEELEVFERCHEFIFKMVSEGIFTGLRVDHIDGLYDPLQYLERLRSRTDGTYVVVEKILAMEEELPGDWPVRGTSGYEYLNYLNGLFCMQQNAAEMEKVYRAFTGENIEYDAVLYEKKGIIINRFMTGDVDNLAHLLKRISSRDRGGCDITLHGMRRAIFELLSFFPVYRTYISPQSFTDADRKYIEEAVRRAEETNPDLLHELGYLKKFLLLEYDGYLNEEDKAVWLSFVMRFQQFTGPLMAKGFEDTTLYIYNRLISLNEVGGEPFSFGVSLDQFHKFNRARSLQWPNALSATATHDTKRGEDMRARINVLSEIPKEWEERAKAWRDMNRSKKQKIRGARVPGTNDEYLFYQTLLGIYPFEAGYQPDEELIGRLKQYLLKALREAKVHTGWITPETDYEEAFMSFIDSVLQQRQDNAFLQDFIQFQKKIASYGVYNSLSQTLLKIACPGVPDFYQGTELWDLSLVDPDNRRPVNYGVRQEYLKEMSERKADAGYVAELLSSVEDGRLKMYLIYHALKARRQHPDVFSTGDYIPLRTTGRFKGNVVAYARKEGSDWAVVIAPRFLTQVCEPDQLPLAEIWDDTKVSLPPRTPAQLNDALTGRKNSNDGSINIADVFSTFPLALLMGF